jgi:hypothetical protein
MRNVVLPIIIVAGALTASTFSFAANTAFSKSAGVIDIAVFGDSPYGTTPTDTSEFEAFPAFIDTINADRDVSLVLHVGDIHSGKQYCTEEYDRSIYDLWTRFEYPLVYTPGDNEWADCHKIGEGGGTWNAGTSQIDFAKDKNGNLIDYASGNPVANLELIRSIFFSKPGYAFGERKLVLSQSQASDPSYPNDAKYVENVMWEQSKVLFVTVNIPGGSNNDADNWYGAPRTQEQTDEIANRTGADIRWLDAAFTRAAADGAVAVVIETQADMWDLDGKAASHIANYQTIIDSIATHTSAFSKPVLLFNGDSHVFRSDNPLVDNSPCVTEGANGTSVTCGNDDYDNQAQNRANTGKAPFNVTNFHRVTVHGSTFPLEWLKLVVDPRANAANGLYAFGPFAWQRMIQQ